MRRMWGEKPYYSFDYYLKEQFGEKVYKLCLNGGMTCPNRDGKIGFGGCSFCSAGGSGDFSAPAILSIPEQIEFEKKSLQKKVPARKFIAYFQAFTNTYGSVDYLRKIYSQAMDVPDVVAVSVATRPDELDQDVVDLMRELSERKPIWVELGLQTIHEETARNIRRGYELPCYEDALDRLSEAGIPVITHVILGLPGETEEMMLETVRYLNTTKTAGVKLQLLHVLAGTDLAADYEAGKFEVLSEDAYVDLVCKCVGNLSPNLVIHRLTGDGPSDSLIAPKWSTAKMTVLNKIHHRLKTSYIYQGSLLPEGEG
ncbi:MAG: TIGR01212 family radical SAM protein [Lachnospiraceae bacterium]|nr:TIGR01212 family radical SAM protein [Lachnospiraceae bacterium]